MASLRAKLLNELIEKLNSIPELEGKMDDPEASEDPNGASVEVLKVSKSRPQEEEEEVEEEIPLPLSEEEEMIEDDDPFAKLRSRMPLKKKVVVEG